MSTAGHDINTIGATLKEQLSKGQNALFETLNTETPADVTVAARTQLIDRIVCDAWLTLLDDSQAACLLAVGGYGRGELNLYSDIDLLVMTANSASDHPEISQFIQLLWDIGLEVGHSVRSLDQCLDQGLKDITIVTNMLEARYLAGSTELKLKLQQAIRAPDYWPPERFYNAKYQEQRDRHARFDDTAYKLEPNLKSSPGGLRDLQTIGWVANRVYQTSDFAALRDKGFINDTELAQLSSSRTQLWRLRNALHSLCKRNEDRLLIAYQKDLADQLGYSDDPEKLAVEKLMQDYYLAAKDISHLNDLLLQHFDQSINYKGSAESKPINQDYHLLNDYVAVIDENLFAARPSALIEVFRIYQNHPHCRGIDAETVRLIKLNLFRINEAYRRDAKNNELFLSLFTHENRLTHTIRKLDAYGVLAEFVPVYGQIVGQMQHDLFHAYTVDAHTLMVIRNLRRIVLADDEDEIPRATELIQSTPGRYRIYLAALFHDVAKGRGGNHDALGAIDAAEFCQQLGLSKRDSDLVAWLVREHLSMSKTSQREDLADPEVIERFAAHVGNTDHLDCLYLLTVADIRATSQSTWTPWKGHLLDALHANTTRFIAAQAPDQADYHVSSETIKTEVKALIGERLPHESVDRFWDMLDEEYFRHYSADTLAWHAEAICSAHVLDLPIVESRYDDELQTITYVIYTAETDQLLGAITGTIDQLSQNIVDARIHEAIPGYTLLLFTVTHTDGVEFSDQLKQRHLDALKHTLIRSTSLVIPAKRMIPRRLKGFEVKTKLQLQDSSDQSATLMNLSTLDRPGLIHQLANILAANRIKLVSAKIATVGEKVEDVFRITNSDGEPLSQAQQDSLTEAINSTWS